jgi:hypothetical protein
MRRDWLHDRAASLGGRRRGRTGRCCDVPHRNVSSAGRDQSPAGGSNNLPWSFLFVPVLAGAVLLAAFAYVWHRWIRRQPWPQRWL